MLTTGKPDAKSLPPLLFLFVSIFAVSKPGPHLCQIKSKQRLQGTGGWEAMQSGTLHSIACEVLIGRNPVPYVCTRNPCYSTGLSELAVLEWHDAHHELQLGIFGARGDAVQLLVRPWKRSHSDRLAVCREKRAALPVQLLHSNDTHDGVDCTQPCEYMEYLLQYSYT
ncbi:hypothetical protein J3F84DRAFT_364105 [Trichoderma pleuroticola]